MRTTHVFHQVIDFKIVSWGQTNLIIYVISKTTWSLGSGQNLWRMILYCASVLLCSFTCFLSFGLFSCCRYDIRVLSHRGVGSLLNLPLFLGIFPVLDGDPNEESVRRWIVGTHDSRGCQKLLPAIRKGELASFISAVLYSRLLEIKKSTSRTISRAWRRIPFTVLGTDVAALLVESNSYLKKKKER